MEYSFSPHQIAEMAAQVEEAGIDFYNKLAIAIDDDKARNVFLFLAQQEFHHRDSFRAFAEEMKGAAEEVYMVDVKSSVAAILHQFTSTTLQAGATSTYMVDVKKALATAIHVEKEAVRLYTGMLKTFVEKFHPVLSKIIDEEKNHLATLSRVQSRLVNKS